MKNTLLAHDDLAAAQFFIGRTDEVDINGKTFQIL